MEQRIVNALLWLTMMTPETDDIPFPTKPALDNARKILAEYAKINATTT